jgi:hypothetical protein
MSIFDQITPYISGQDWIFKNHYGEAKYIPPRDPQLNFCPNWPGHLSWRGAAATNLPWRRAATSLPWRGAATSFEAPLFKMRSHGNEKKNDGWKNLEKTHQISSIRAS